MRSDANIEWEVDPDRATRDEAKDIVDQIVEQVEDQTDEEVVIREGEELEPVSGSTIVVFALGVGSSLTARAIWEALKEQDETKDVDVDVDIDDVDESDVDVDITIK